MYKVQPQTQMMKRYNSLLIPLKNQLIKSKRKTYLSYRKITHHPPRLALLVRLHLSSFQKILNMMMQKVPVQVTAKTEIMVKV